jgi:hypothetical protein
MSSFAILIILKYILLIGLIILVLLIPYKRLLRKIKQKNGALTNYITFSGDAIARDKSSGKWVVSLHVPVSQDVKIEVYSILNELKIGIYKGLVPQGEHTFDAVLDQLGPGKYICRITSAGQTSDRYFKIP